MWLPKSVGIAGFRVKIRLRDLDEMFGYYEQSAKTIFLDRGNKPKIQLETLRHEMLEASFFLTGIAYCERFEQEAVIRCVDEVFFPAYNRIINTIQKNNAG